MTELTKLSVAWKGVATFLFECSSSPLELQQGSGMSPLKEGKKKLTQNVSSERIIGRTVFTPTGFVTTKTLLVGVL